MARATLHLGGRLLLGLGFGILVCATLGCRGDKPLPLLPVASKVLIDGQPLTKGSVVFRPDASKGNKSQDFATSGLTEQGTYELYSGHHKGIAPGWYRVQVFPMILSSMHDVPKYAPAGLEDTIVPEKYMDAKETPLTVEVVEHAPEGAYLLKLTR